jgi:hypothetical protein
MKGNEARQKYKKFLSSQNNQLDEQDDHAALEKARKYWVGQDDNDDPIRVWSITEPLKGRGGEEEKMRKQIRQLIGDLMESFKVTNGVYSAASPCCQQQDENTTCVTSDEALFVVFLASVSQQQRYDIVMNFKSKVDTIVREELLKEASLINEAIQMSDQFTSFEEISSSESN